MTAQTKPYPAVTALIDTFADWLKHRRELSEMVQQAGTQNTAPQVPQQ